MTEEGKESIDAALKTLDAVVTIIPQCSMDYDQILVIGMIKGQHYMITVDWGTTLLKVTSAEPVRLGN